MIYINHTLFIFFFLFEGGEKMTSLPESNFSICRGDSNTMSLQIENLGPIDEIDLQIYNL
ncbi:hypothetical protein ACB092_02G230900 [Castanea dentata]